MTRVELHQVKRGEGRKVWMLRWFGTDGKRYGETLGDVGDMSKRDAEAAQRAKQSSFDAGGVKVDKPRRMTLEAFRTFHADIARGEVSGGTLALYANAFDWAEKTIGKACILESVNARHVAQVRNALTDAKRASGTIQRVLSYLRAAFERAKVHNLIRDNPFLGVAVEGGADAKPATIRTREELRQLKAAAPDAWWKAAIGLWFCGLRLDEALAMQWDAVDFKGGKVTVRKAKAGTFKVDGETYPLLAWTAKRPRSYRVVPVPADTIQALRELQLQSGGSPYLFLSLTRLRTIQAAQDAGKWRANGELVLNVLRDWKALQARTLAAGAKPCTVHDCRKAFCTHAADLIPIHTLAEIVGDTVAVLTRYYTKAKDEHADTLRKAFDDGPALKLAS